MNIFSLLDVENKLKQQKRHS